MLREQGCEVVHCSEGGVLGSGRRDYARNPMTLQAYFCPCPRGLESVLAAELARCDATAIRPVPGGAEFSGSIETGYRVNLWSRVASRVLRRVAHGPYRDEQSLYDLVRAVAWRDWFDVERTLRVDVTAVKSPLKSLDFATLRVKDAICDRFRDEIGKRPSVDTRDPDVRVSAFLTADRATIYLDTSGEALFKRGYRRDAGDAPLKENLAAGIIALTGWEPHETFFDPMCGSGTFVIEAALIALGIAPGANRSFGFERLVDFDAASWSRLREQARRAERPRDPLAISGSDVHRRAIERAAAVAAQAGLGDVVRFAAADILDAAPPEPPGVMVVNPPYGVRVGEADALAAFYPKLGTALKTRYVGWRCYVFTGDLGLPRAVRLRESKRTPLYNGTIECRLFEFKMVAGSARDQRAHSA
jgi:putative N6-adenine-specific DNA methylase